MKDELKRLELDAERCLMRKEGGLIISSYNLSYGGSISVIIIIFPIEC